MKKHRAIQQQQNSQNKLLQDYGIYSYDSSPKNNALSVILHENILASRKHRLPREGIRAAAGEVLGYSILNNYMHSPKANFAQVYINGAYIGFYSSAENINKEFCSDHFYSSNGTFIKCNPIVTPGPSTKSNLKYLNSTDSSLYFNYYEIKSNNGWNELVKLCDSVTNHQNKLESFFDLDRLIWMMAFNNVFVNLDSYSGVFSQNYYVYKDLNSRYNPIVWDLNMSFGGFPYIGSGATGMGGLTPTQMQQLTATAHQGDAFWPLLNGVYNQAQWKRMYIAHMRTLLNENIANNAYTTMATQLQTIADTAINSDPNKFFTYTQFQNGLTTNYTVSTYTVPGIGNLMSARNTYLQNTADFLAVPPTISNINTSPTLPVLNSNVDITATIINSNNVYLGYRSYTYQKFTKVSLYDDGMHNDGAAGDNVFGASFTMASNQMQYYIYAENNAAGIFSPERAEHEFYLLNSGTATAGPGQITINEYLAINQNDATDENGAHADWIELYNTTNSNLSLSGLYLSDDPLNKTKFAFPPNAVIPANGYLIVWADEGISTATHIHANFKLASSGEYIILSNGSANTLDSVAFGTQTADVSEGRCPNGTGAITTLGITSFGFANCALGISENNAFNVRLYPNPANEELNLTSERMMEEDWMILDLYGKEILKGKFTGKTKIDIQSLSSGIYFLQSGSTAIKFIKTSD